MAGGLVAAATGPGNAIRAAAPGPVGPFVDLSPAFESWPSWAVPNKDVWAPDLAKVGGRWLMFYAVRVTDLGTEGRCIAVAAAPTPDATFHPVGDRPLVCPANAQTPRAEDRVRGHGTATSPVRASSTRHSFAAAGESSSCSTGHRGCRRRSAWSGWRATAPGCPTSRRAAN